MTNGQYCVTLSRLFGPLWGWGLPASDAGVDSQIARVADNGSFEFRGCRKEYIPLRGGSGDIK